MKREISRLTWTDRRGVLRERLTFALVADLHNCPFDDALDAMAEAGLILVAGDVTNRHRRGPPPLADAFLREAPRLAPVYYALGNHEKRMRGAGAWRQKILDSGARLLDNEAILLRPDVMLGALSSQPKVHPDLRDASVVDTLAAFDGFRLLMCHHPEYYPQHVAGHGIDLTLSGHAHGGQVRIGGQGLYSPGQGLLPRYTAGWYDDRHLLVSRGMSNHAIVPRINNPCELIILTLEPG